MSAKDKQSGLYWVLCLLAALGVFSVFETWWVAVAAYLVLVPLAWFVSSLAWRDERAAELKAEHGAKHGATS